jgi:hypothetical protein
MPQDPPPIFFVLHKTSGEWQVISVVFHGDIKRDIRMTPNIARTYQCGGLLR